MKLRQGNIMRKLVQICSIFIFLMGANAMADNYDSALDFKRVMSVHKWEHRVILLQASDAGQDSYNHQKEIFKTQSEAMEERDLIVIDISSEDLQALFGGPVTDFTFVLIGKDGSEKLRSGTVVQTQDLFALIDSMPMRQNEVRQREMQQ